jgi:hypothetical protein
MPPLNPVLNQDFLCLFFVRLILMSSPYICL